MTDEGHEIDCACVLCHPVQKPAVINDVNDDTLGMDRYVCMVHLSWDPRTPPIQTALILPLPFSLSPSPLPFQYVSKILL